MKKTGVLSFFDKAAPVLGILAVGLLYLETRHELRKRKQKQWERLQTNGAVAATASVGLRLALLPALVWGARQAQEKKSGLLHWLGLPRPVQPIAAFLLLDYGNYLWHILNHRSSLLWRFHHVHHTDLDLDVSTAWRFHLGEVGLSALFRGAIARLVGPSPLTVVLYELWFEGATAFHHSNWRLPYGLEKVLCWLVVTPRMHGIHHSIVLRETNSNFSVIFPFWDRLHRTARLNVPQQQISIGVPSYRNPAELTFAQLQALPFAPPRAWKLPDGSVPDRAPEQVPKDHLVK